MIDKEMILHYLETHLVDHYNLNCKGCGHFSPLSDKKFTDFKSFERDLIRLRELFDNISIIRLMGGEPLLHPDVSAFLEFTRLTFHDARIVLVTNGILLLKQSERFWEKCSKNDVVIEITKYPIKLDFEAIEKKRKSFSVKIETRGIVTRFYKGINIAGNSDPSIAFHYCQSKFKCPFLQDGKIYICAFPALVHIFNKYFVRSIPVTEADSIDIYANINGSDILDFLNSPGPMCRWCLSNWPTFKWKVSGREIDEWIGTDPGLLRRLFAGLKGRMFEQFVRSKNSQRKN
jgi:organic radical activating enzyme